MMNRRAATLLTMSAALAAVLFTAEARPTTRYIWNASDSVPVGLYRVMPIRELFVTELVAVHAPEPLAAFLDEAGYLPHGVPMLKRVLALPGQTACRHGEVITIDNIEMGRAHQHDSRSRRLPVWQGCHVIADNEVFLMNWQSANSLDGRYFGVLPATAIIGVAKPVWTDEEN